MIERTTDGRPGVPVVVDGVPIRLLPAGALDDEPQDVRDHLPFVTSLD